MMLTKRLGAFVGKGAKDVMVDLPVLMIPWHGVGGNCSTYCGGYRVHIELGQEPISCIIGVLGRLSQEVLQICAR